MRIISTVPSQTELLADLDLENEVVGITKFCVHPNNWFRNKTRIGGTKNLNLEKIRDLNADLIIANKEENTKEQIENLSQDHEIFVSDIKTLNDNLNLILQLGQLTKREDKAQALHSKLSQTVDSIKNADNKLNRKRVAYLIWYNPLMVAGGDTYINNTLELCGMENIFKSKMRYPETSFEELKSLKLDYILLSSEPFPFKDKHIQEFTSELAQCQAHLVDGEAFSWYGTRLLKSEEYLNNFLAQINGK